MKTKSIKTDPKTPAEIPVPANPSAPVVESEKVSRLSFALDSNGKPDWDKMHEKTRVKVKELMGEGASKTAVASTPVEVFDPAWCGTMFDVVGKIESFAAAKLYKMPQEVADRAFTYSQAEKDKLAGPTAKVINKYAPLWLETYKDEIALAGLFVMITAMKFQMATMLMTQLNKTGAVSPQAPSPSPKVVDVRPDLSGIEAEILKVDPDGTIHYKEGQKN
jgi:hypothetical protein